MPKKICWKKGMRLTHEVLKASDQCSIDLVNNAFALAAAGRFGLLPSSTPFDLSINISKGMLDVVSLNCLAVTRDGSFIEAQYDTRYTNTFDTRVKIPENMGAQEFILTINAERGQWCESNDWFEEPVYSFGLVLPDSPVAVNALPIGRIVDSEYGGWRIDDMDFVPPCLFVSSHPKFKELLERFRELLSEINQKVVGLLHSDGKNAIRIFWPIIQQLMITADKEADLMTPMMLLSNVQKCISAFTCACDLDDYLELDGGDLFRSYIMRPYSYKTAYTTIKEGLDICFQISEKVDKLNSQPEPEPSHDALNAPTIESSQLVKRCTNSTTRITVTNNAPGATVYYTTDGNEPSQASKKGLNITLDSGFASARTKEPDKIFTVKVKAFLNGVWSATNTFEVTLKKDIARWTGIEI